MEPFNDSNFAELVKNKNILFLGDSISQEQFYELECMLWRHLDINRTRALRETFTKTIHNRKTVKDGYVLNSNCTIFYIRSDYIVHTVKYTVQINETEDEEYNTIWAHVGKESDILILNTGTHLAYEHWKISLPIAIENVLQYLWLLKEQNPKLTVIYRTSLLGVDNCSNYTTPMLPKSYNRYNWSLLEYYDKIWYDKVKQNSHWNGEWLWLNITQLSHYRSDARSNPPIDCLHMCIPGPIRTWNQILFNMLKNKKQLSF